MKIKQQSISVEEYKNLIGHITADESNMISYKIKPLSVNEVWQGKKFKTNAYLVYEKALLYTLPNLRIPKAPYLLRFEFGFSTKNSDLDNPVKPLIDILQKKYSFNDRDIYRLEVEKKIVKKGEEYFKYSLHQYK